jgi:hypothetical protein
MNSFHGHFARLTAPSLLGKEISQMCDLTMTTDPQLARRSSAFLTQRA